MGRWVCGHRRPAVALVRTNAATALSTGPQTVNAKPPYPACEPPQRAHTTQQGQKQQKRAGGGGGGVCAHESGRGSTTRVGVGAVQSHRQPCETHHDPDDHHSRPHATLPRVPAAPALARAKPPQDTTAHVNDCCAHTAHCSVGNAPGRTGARCLWGPLGWRLQGRRPCPRHRGRHHYWRRHSRSPPRPQTSSQWHRQWRCLRPWDRPLATTTRHRCAD
jgi:hypothetical protein